MLGKVVIVDILILLGLSPIIFYSKNYVLPFHNMLTSGFTFVFLALGLVILSVFSYFFLLSKQDFIFVHQIVTTSSIGLLISLGLYCVFIIYGIMYLSYQHTPAFSFICEKILGRHYIPSCDQNSYFQCSKVNTCLSSKIINE